MMVLLVRVQTAETPETGPAISEASAHILELSPANSGIPLLLASGHSSAPASSEDRTPPRGLSLGSTSHGTQATQYRPAGPARGRLESSADINSLTDMPRVCRRSTAQHAAALRDTEAWARRRATIHLPLKSPFEAHPEIMGVLLDSADSPADQSSSTGNQREGGTANADGGRRCSASQASGRQPGDADVEASAGAVRKQKSLENLVEIGSSRDAKQAPAVDTKKAQGNLLPSESSVSNAARSSISHLRAPHSAASNAPDASMAQHASQEEVEMVSLTLNEHETLGLARRRSQSLPCRTSRSEALLDRPRFNLMVYAGWLPPSLKTPPPGGWTDSVSANRQRLDESHLDLDRSQRSSIDLSSKPLLGLP